MALSSFNNTSREIQQQWISGGSTGLNDPGYFAYILIFVHSRELIFHSIASSTDFLATLSFLSKRLARYGQRDMGVFNLFI